MTNIERKRTIIRINKHCKTNALLIVSPEGDLRWISCPFKALVTCEVNGLFESQEVLVNAVKMDVGLRLVYVVDGVSYHYFFFAIL